jgi:hypothetical protein
MSITDFCINTKRLLTEGRHADFVKMALCGLYNGSQIAVDAILDRMDDREQFEGSRDYDSLLGISEHIRIRGPLTVYPIAKHDDTLKTDLHIKHTFHCRQVSL